MRFLNMYQQSFCLGNQGIYQGVYLFGFSSNLSQAFRSTEQSIYVSPETLVNTLKL